MSFIETLDSLALRKSELIERFEHLIASKSIRNSKQWRKLHARSHCKTLGGPCASLHRSIFPTNASTIVSIAVSRGIIRSCASHLPSMKSWPKRSISREQGFRQILLVAGEHPKFVSSGYLAECVRALAPDFSSISIEVGPMDTEDYAPIVEAGAEGLGRLSRDIQSRCVCRDAHGWAETRF